MQKENKINQKIRKIRPLKKLSSKQKNNAMIKFQIQRFQETLLVNHRRFKCRKLKMRVIKMINNKILINKEMVIVRKVLFKIHQGREIRVNCSKIFLNKKIRKDNKMKNQKMRKRIINRNLKYRTMMIQVIPQVIKVKKKLFK